MKNYICPDCRTSKSGSILDCPFCDCGKEMLYIGAMGKPPKKNDDEGWERVLDKVTNYQSTWKPRDPTKKVR